MTTKPEPVGWWCEDCENVSGELHETELSKSWAPSNTCHAKGEPTYTRTQVRKGFEGLAEWMDEQFRKLETIRNPWLREVVKIGFLAYSEETRRRMEEW